MWVTTHYCAPAARSKNAKGRGQEGGGVYPEFGVLGIQKGSSPALVREVGRQVALLPSYAMAREELARRGLDLDIKELYGIGKYAGAAALTYRRRLLEHYCGDRDGSVAGAALSCSHRSIILAAR